jgi:hypothetical protein
VMVVTAAAHQKAAETAAIDVERFGCTMVRYPELELQ